MEINRWWLTVVVWVCVSCGVQGPPGGTGGEPASPTSVASYLGQTPPTTEAIPFAPGVVSKPGSYEYALSVHPAGDRFLFTVECPDEGAKVHQSRFENGVWTPPTRVDLSGGARTHEMEAFFGVDGDRIFFAPYSKGMDVRIWTAGVTAEGLFVEPRALGGPVADDPSFYPVQGTDGSLFYTNLAKRSVWRATFANDAVSGTRDAGLERGGHAFPSPDGRFVLIDSASLDSDEQRDIYVSFRNDDGTWGEARPLGPSVNTEYSETCPSLSPDGRYLFFSRYNEPGGVSDIYWIDAEVIAAAAPV